MASNYHHPLDEIDLNIEFIQSHIEDGNNPRKIYNHLQDVNDVAMDNFVIDLNVTPSSPSNGMPQPTHPTLDLNQEPISFSEENNDHSVDGETTTDENVEFSNESMDETDFSKSEC
ncbi:OLC1v1028558C1 [Oldenlandia corymbosa var. corymbosa]|uniref:OLC1v1028558C1 n=1 Tax=Oldenlandia corymbosa var. corymbosa TaxID=529605 RepID=A0AAV1CEZ3_OLDCO|nr:OLC1v1028558C1 [Oldenlandia corymbosa var. corymbosa]